MFNLATQTIDADTALFSPGVQLGAHNLLGPFGLRVTGEYSVYPYRGVLELGADALLNIGTAIDPYVGVGVGLAGEGGVSLALARLVGGIAPRLDEGYGLFAEAVLTGYGDLLGSGNPLGYAFKA